MIVACHCRNFAKSFDTYLDKAGSLEPGDKLNDCGDVMRISGGVARIEIKTPSWQVTLLDLKANEPVLGLR